MGGWQVVLAPGIQTSLYTMYLVPVFLLSDLCVNNLRLEIENKMLAKFLSYITWTYIIH